MANLQYIGARYVPTFANPIEWDNVRSYEPLTIVTYYGTSYTSKKSVPPGVALSNAEYWAVTGNYNAQVAQIQNEVNAINQNITSIQSSISSIKNSYFTNRKVLCIGDSYNLSTTSWGGWGLKFSQLYPYIPVFTYGEGGGGFAHAGETGKTFLNLLQIAAEIIGENCANITDIIVLGGYNDMSTRQTRADITTAIANFLAYCQTNFPNATLRIGFIGADSRLNGEEFQCLTYANYYKYGCQICGVRYVNNAQYILLDSSLLLDDGSANAKFHPNVDGCAAIANWLPFIIQNIEIDVKYQYVVANKFQFTIHNDFCTINGANNVQTQTYLSLPEIAPNTWVNAYVVNNRNILWGGDTYCWRGGVTAVNLTDHMSYIINMRYNSGVFQVMCDSAGYTLASGLHCYVPTITAPTEFFY